MEENRSYLSVSELLSRSFHLLKDNILEVLKVIAIFIIPSLLVIGGLVGVFVAGSIFSGFMGLSYGFSSSNYYNSVPSIGLGAILLIFVFILLLSIVLMYANAIIVKILDDANKGNEVNWRTANRYVWERKWSVIGLNILVGLMLVALVIAMCIIVWLLVSLTNGIILIILVPLILGIIFIISPINMVFTSELIVRDLSVTDAIGEGFALFKGGYFWSTVGKLAAITGVMIGIAIVLAVFELIPVLGFIVSLLGQFIIQSYAISYINVFVYNRSEKREEFINPIM